jgi:hemerythrin-like domain-containing protein
MCEHCGCRGVDSVGELMEEHVALLQLGHRVRAALAEDDRAALAGHLELLVAHLGRHVRREEAGIFTALREQGEFAEEVDSLEAEHDDLDAAIAGLDLDHPDLPARAARLLDDLAEHIEREDLGIFPVSVVTLGAGGWETVERAHQRHPSFLPARPAPVP